MNVSNPLVGERRPGTVGLPMPLVAVRILDEAGEPVAGRSDGRALGEGTRMCATGTGTAPTRPPPPSSTAGSAPATSACARADGYITLQGRRSDLIISGGFNIYPREIEEVLTSLPGIREAAVVGVADAVRGEVPVAYLVADARSRCVGAWRRGCAPRSRRSRCHAGSSASTRCRARRSARCRSTCCRPGRDESGVPVASSRSCS